MGKCDSSNGLLISDLSLLKMLYMWKNGSTTDTASLREANGRCSWVFMKKKIPPRWQMMNLSHEEESRATPSPSQQCPASLKSTFAADLLNISPVLVVPKHGRFFTSVSATWAACCDWALLCTCHCHCLGALFVFGSHLWFFVFDRIFSGKLVYININEN